MQEHEERIRELSEVFINNLSDAEQQALGALFLRGGDEGLCALEDHLTGALYDQTCSIGEQFSELADCEKCQGTGKTKRKQEEVTCSQCKGFGKFEPLMPNMAIALHAEGDFIFDLFGGHDDPWEKYKYLEVEISNQIKVVKEKEEE